LAERVSSEVLQKKGYLKGAGRGGQPRTRL
jgi:hypothetical protein